jgi:hypothetical protein
MWMWQETLLQKFVKFGVNLTFFCTLVTMATAAILNVFNPHPKAATHYGGYLNQKNRNPLGKLCRSCHENKKRGDLIFFWFLSSNFINRCRNIHRSVWQLLGGGWKHSKAMIIFVFFNVLAFWPFPCEWQPFWKNQSLKAQLHMAYDIPTRFHKVWSISAQRVTCYDNFCVFHFFF